MQTRENVEVEYRKAKASPQRDFDRHRSHLLTVPWHAPARSVAGLSHFKSSSDGIIEIPE
jgi:hypothetical protein